jgi:hypothetical protein
MSETQEKFEELKVVRDDNGNRYTVRKYKASNGENVTSYQLIYTKEEDDWMYLLDIRKVMIGTAFVSYGVIAALIYACYNKNGQ